MSLYENFLFVALYLFILQILYWVWPPEHEINLLIIATGAFIVSIITLILERYIKIEVKLR